MTNQVDEKEFKRLVQDEAMKLPDLNIAVSGIAGRFPSADSLNEFEENLLEGKDMIEDQDNTRFICGLWGLPPRAGRLKDLSKFDSEFFGFTHEEANYIDFQLRILYEVVYESILDAGVNPSSLRGTNTGVFFGLHCNEFENAMADDPGFKPNGYYAQFGIKIAQYFDFRGINITFDAACASGFVGLHNAVEALNDGIIDQAIVCSSNIPINPTGSFVFLQMQMLSPTGYSRFLDSRADGYVKSEACVSVLLQRKHMALRNYASIMATMTSVDGYKPEGITFPSDTSQETLIREAKKMAGISTNHVEYLEAHGTGTPAGDPQECRAISRVYFPTKTCDNFEKKDEKKNEEMVDERKIGPLLMGSVKTNMGHSEAASGLCALAKVVLMLENELIYKGLHYAQPNGNIEALMDKRLRFVEDTMDLRAKIIPLSCYGFGGANVHAIVRANHRLAIDYGENRGKIGEAPRLIVMFGRNEDNLNYFFNQLLKTKSRNTSNCLTDDFLYLVDSLNSQSIDRLMNYRGYLVVDRGSKMQTELARGIKKCDLVAAVKDQQQQLDNDDLGRQAHVQDCAQRKCNLIFPGLGCHWPGMASGLLQYKPFWSTIERLVLLLEPFKFEISLIRILTDQNYSLDSMTEKFVAIVAYQVALINIVRDQLKLSDLGCIVGHSLGEISCAYAAGLFDERETIMVAYHMGKTLDENKHLIQGRMVALGINEIEALEKISGFKTIRVSCVNGPNSVTISGSPEDMDSFCSSIDEKKYFMKRVENSIAIHNEIIMTKKIKQLLKDSLLKVLFPGADYNRERTSWISSAAGEIDTRQANAEYFADSMCKKVDFLKSIDQLNDDSIALELAPNGSFESQLRRLETASAPCKPKLHYIKMMKRSTLTEEQPLMLVKSIGELYQAGAKLSLVNFYKQDNVIELPVRRQTPSLSSLFKWSHQQSVFVPRYPIQFSKSSAKCEMPVDILQDRDKYIVGHCIEGRILYPATGYLFLIWRVFSFTKRQIYDACFQDVERELQPIEFHNVRLLRAFILGNRLAQVYIHYEEGTGRFEIKEGGSVVAEGYARSPVDSPNGLLYDNVREQIKKENLELTLNSDDIYKQFRVSGYDYGETFRNIKASSGDGRFCRVKYNGYFVALTDSILQSIFLAISQYAPSGGLFLPTRFDYVRFQPEIILSKIRQAKMVFDLGDGSLNTKAKREIMTKLMERESGNTGVSSGDLDKLRGDNNETNIEPKAECIFETFCDPTTGIIITDGIEMRGIKATPAPRRADSNEVMLESYQFVKDLEDPIEDEYLTKFEQINKRYVRICDSMSMKLLAKLCCKNSLKLNGVFFDDLDDLADEKEINAYKSKYLKSVCKKQDGGDHQEDYDYDIKKNGDLMLMSVMDQLLSYCSNPKTVKEVIQKNRLHLMRDLIQNSFSSERFMRPIIETVIENICVKKMKFRMIEINSDDGIMKDALQHLMRSIEPSLLLDYSLAHPDLNRLIDNKVLDSNQTKTYTLKDLQSLFNGVELRDLDLIVYKDTSCYSLPKQVIEYNGMAPVLSLLNGAAHSGGFIIVIMRQKLTISELILLSLSEPELVGLSKKDLVHIKANETTATSTVDKIDRINQILASRCKLMMNEAEKNKMICLGKKSDLNGCTVFLFKTTNCNKLDSGVEKPLYEKQRVLLRITHDTKNNIDNWLEDLKQQFKKNQQTSEPIKEQTVGSEGISQNVTKELLSSWPMHSEQNQVWLCAVATKENPISGLIGMMQALRKELGSAYLRCYYDCHTFKNRNEPISLLDIEQCEKFQQSIRRDLIWNCINSLGQFGSYRHFTINDYLTYQDCCCSETVSASEEEELNRGTIENTIVPFQFKSAYVNNAIRGDLSSFTWYEAPLRYLNENERKSLVRVSYSALNFRDIMLATGRLPLDAIPIHHAMSDCLLGLEFSGLDISTGKRVIGMVNGQGISTHVLCPKESSIKIEIPDWLTLKEAATIPVVYATAIMALVYRGKMKRGESVLIHAGSGGVGQAAINLAAHYGLEIFTTVGSTEKRKFLLEEFSNCLSDDHIFSSRDCNFEAQIMSITRGKGVDLVLNSLADDKLQASIRCLSDGGRFLEIGKYDLSTDSSLELLKLDTNKTFHGILLDKIFDVADMGPSFKQQLKGILETLKDGLAKGYVKPIRHTMFKKNQIEEAFRFMATGKHIGKVLIEINNDDNNKTYSSERSSVGLLPASQIKCVPKFQLSPLKSYIVTGGLGGFGMELTKWLVKQGARLLLLTSRSGIKTGYQKVTLQRLEACNKGVKFLIVDNNIADTTTQNGTKQLCEIALEMSPIKEIGGIFHLAMVLKDSLLDNMSGDDFLQVCRPKLDTCVHLDTITREMRLKLDYFVAFSSITSGKGNAGQANYAYANSCLERVCERRRQHGLHGLAIQWGAIGDVGVAFENLGGNDIIIGGTIPQRMPSCLTTLAKLLGSPFSTCLSVVPVNRGGHDGSGQKGDLVGAVMHVLGIKDPSKVSDQASLGELGLDSLMAVEIRQYIEREYDMTLNIQEIRSLTIAKIRDISENERLSSGSLSKSSGNDKSVKGDTNENVNGAREVDNYGIKVAEQIKSNERLANEAIEAMIDKNMVSVFVPQLKLPETDYCRLNYNHLAHNGQINGSSSNGLKVSSAQFDRPIFFLPPIHGEFDGLKLICSTIKRPCIGLHWTRKLGRTKSVEEAVEVYLDLLKRPDWGKEFCLPQNYDDEDEKKYDGDEISSHKTMTRIVDLVGYSYGATIAFEMMLAIHRLQQQAARRLSHGLKDNQTGGLIPGRLILLDGSPKQFELGSSYLSSFTRKKPLQLSEKVDELLMMYIMAHTRKKNVNYIELQRSLSKVEIEDKIKLASARLFKILGLKDTIKKKASHANNDDNDDELFEDEQTKIGHAMESFCRRYELINSYKTSANLPSDCTLIRAEKIFLGNREEKFNEDLDLSSVVEGKVSLFVMPGDHDTFLKENYYPIGEIITKHCS